MQYSPFPLYNYSIMKIDLHCHTNFSEDGISCADDIFRAARERGLDGLAVTDHNTCAGWPQARQAAQKFNMILVLGQEIKSKQGDILGLFLRQEIDGKDKEIKWIIGEIHKQGGLAALAHPLSIFEGFRGNIEEIAPLLDGIEVFNSRRGFDNREKDIVAIARKYNLAMTGGSDAHQAAVCGLGYTEVENAKIAQEFKQGLIARQSRAFGKKAGIIFILFSQSKKWLSAIFPDWFFKV